MLTREGFVAADMSGQGTLQRSSWKAEAIRRGDLKISGPIPIKEDTPLNEEEEREFAETGVLSPGPPQDEIEQEIQRPNTPPQPDYPAPTRPVSRPMSRTISLTSHPIEDQDRQLETLQERQPSRSPPRIQPSLVSARESVAQPKSHTSPTQLRSTPESSSRITQKKKRKSGLRNVFRKMFGRKSRDEEEEPARRGHSYHHSDPGMLRQSTLREEATPSGPRISDLPVKELEPLHPLGQQLPFPMNVNAPQASPPNEYIHFDTQKLGPGRRRATLPSLSATGSQRHSLDEARVRLTTWDEGLDEDTTSSPGIGIALSSPSHAVTSIAQKRRSRSAEPLRDPGRDSTSVERRRSAEIRYWRQSYASGSVYSRPQTAKTVETVRSVQQQEPAITQSAAEAVEMSATLAHADEPSPLPEEHVVRELVPEVEQPGSAFNFGLTSGFSDDTAPSDVRSPMTPPIQEPVQNRHSIEERITNLEGNIQSIELSLRRMSSRNNRQTIILSDAPRNLRSRARDSSSRSASTGSDNVPAYRSSNDTLKSGPSSPTLVRPGTTEAEHAGKDKVIEKLYDALKYERSARKALEQQVQSLQSDIADLHALVNKLIASATATSPMYPTPSPDAVIITSTEERLVTPRPAQTRNYTLDENKENDDIRESVISKFSRSDSSRSLDGHRERAAWKASTDDVASPDVWATPKEEGFSDRREGFFEDKAGFRGY